MQRGDGLFGPLVIKPKFDMNYKEYNFDLNEHIIIIDDWFDETIVSKFAFHHHSTTDNNRPTAILINGKGVDLRQNSTIQTPRAVFTVQKGFRYRFRLINSGVSFCPIQFIVDNHNLTVIASDGKLVEPQIYESVTLHAGNLKVKIIYSKS
jgi:L-ascorbate oxidase